MLFHSQESYETRRMMSFIKEKEHLLAYLGLIPALESAC